MDYSKAKRLLSIPEDGPKTKEHVFNKCQKSAICQNPHGHRGKCKSKITTSTNNKLISNSSKRDKKRSSLSNESMLRKHNVVIKRRKSKNKEEVSTNDSSITERTDYLSGLFLGCNLIPNCRYQHGHSAKCKVSEFNENVLREVPKDSTCMKNINCTKAVYHVGRCITETALVVDQPEDNEYKNISCNDVGASDQSKVEVAEEEKGVVKEYISDDSDSGISTNENNEYESTEAIKNKHVQSKTRMLSKKIARQEKIKAAKRLQYEKNLHTFNEATWVVPGGPYPNWGTNTTTSSSDAVPYLVPITLDITSTGHQFRDVFQWNLYETKTTALTFAENLCFDLDLPSAFKDHIRESITNQLDGYRERMKLHENDLNDLAKEEIAKWATEKEMVVPLDIHVEVNKVVYVDCVEWDLFNESNSPEVFAHQTCIDLGLPGEFEMKIATSLRDKILMFKEAMGKLNKDSIRVMEKLNIEEVIRPIVDRENWEPQLSLDDEGR